MDCQGMNAFRWNIISTIARSTRKHWNRYASKTVWSSLAISRWRADFSQENISLRPMLQTRREAISCDACARHAGVVDGAANGHCAHRQRDKLDAIEGTDRRDQAPIRRSV